ncbi:enoyl-CoA hydratase-related protein [Granulosicoccus sp. 3-233]|uniref:enoyl-CoA hydratase-related protein n=1 Tax=Granulosicoccus sp. 3-233 TaxID=3417969 RepID=UPI003D344F62
MSLNTIKTAVEANVATLTIDRPEALNALNRQVMLELTQTLRSWEQDDEVRAIIITGSQKAFAAGADIKEMQSVHYLDALHTQFLKEWESVANCSKPTIAAVAGYALGGGCELAMMCDFILAADNARFGQPEIKIGTLPGMGGTQRLTRLIGKSKAMEMCLTGRMMDAEEAERAGLVSRVVPAGELQEEAFRVAREIASYSAPAVQLNRMCINAALNTTLEQGVAIERQAFLSLFGTDDQKEGMQAFQEKRKPDFTR